MYVRMTMSAHGAMSRRVSSQRLGEGGGVYVRMKGCGVVLYVRSVLCDRRVSGGVGYPSVDRDSRACQTDRDERSAELIFDFYYGRLRSFHYARMSASIGVLRIGHW